MCYAFTEAMHPELDFEKAIDISLPLGPILHYSVGKTSKPATAPGKRPAGDPLENHITKATKLTHDGREDSAMIECEENKEPESAEEQAAKYKRHWERASQLCEQSKAQNQKINREYKNLEQRHDTILYQLKEYEIEHGKNQVEEKTDKARARAIAQAMVQDERQKTKDACSKRLDSWKVKYEQQVKTLKGNHEHAIADLKIRHKNALKNKDWHYQKEMKAIKDKAEREDKKFQDAKAGYNKELKSLKAQHREVQKSLRAEQVESINAWKPEHSQTVKEKNSALNDKVKEAKALEISLQSTYQENEALRAKLDGANTAMDNNRALLQQKQDDLNDFRRHLTELNDDHGRLLSENADMQLNLEDTKQHMNQAHQAELKRCAERWTIQYNKAENFAQDVVVQQRVNFQLRNSMDGKNEKIEKMQDDIKKLSEQVRETTQVEQRARRGRSRVDSFWDS